MPKGATRTSTGLIPAHAGKTISRMIRVSGLGAHPRSRGENAPIATTAKPMGGSSPLTRGKLALVQVNGAGKRLIPAHAGKTRFPSRDVRARWAHPRSRGENSWLPSCVRRFAGSSPLTRGKPSSRSRAKPVRGLIPAHAGKTPARPAGRRTPGAHPRSRGENMNWDTHTWRGVGSSPLTRGKPCDWTQWRACNGLIPAHAGKTVGPDGGGGHGWAHPRSRGENMRTDYRIDWIQGSSPLTRGKHGTKPRRSYPRRLIPAHAGKTRSMPAHGLGLRAHPRSRGEN